MEPSIRAFDADKQREKEIVEGIRQEKIKTLEKSLALLHKIKGFRAINDPDQTEKPRMMEKAVEYSLSFKRFGMEEAKDAAIRMGTLAIDHPPDAHKFNEKFDQIESVLKKALQD